MEKLQICILVLLGLLNVLPSNAQLVTEQSRDEAFLAPTSLMTSHVWCSVTDSYEGKCCSSLEDIFGIGEIEVLFSELHLLSDGTYRETLHVKSSRENSEESKKSRFDLKWSGRWNRHEKMFLRRKPDEKTVRVVFYEYDGTQKSRLSERKRYEVSRLENSIKQSFSSFLNDIKTCHQLKDFFGQQIQRLDKNFLILGSEDGGESQATCYMSKQQYDSFIKKNDYSAELPTQKMGKTFDVVEQMPSFPGGDAEMMKYLSSNIRYPLDARRKGIRGRVIATFVVESDGSISNISIIKSVEPSLDAEAIRVLNSMPRWIPGRHNGKAVRVKYNVPVTFM